MALDILLAPAGRRPGSADRPVLSLGDREFDALAPVWEEYERRTGRRIDQYGSLIVPAGTLRPLADALATALVDAATPEARAAIQALRAVVARAAEEGVGLHFAGD